VVYFEVYNDSTDAAPRAWMYVDDVNVQSCPSGAPAADTATPTPVPPEATGTPTSTPASTPVPTATPTATPQPPVCGERVANGGFEQTTAWTFATTATTGRYATEKAHSGARSARLGIAPVAGGAGVAGDAAAPAAGERNLLGELAVDAASYSTAYQTMSLPAGAQTLRLRYWYWTGTDATAGNADFQRVLLLKPGTYGVLKTLSKSLSNGGEWRQGELDLSPYAGQSVVLYFEVYNDNTAASPRTWMYVDDVSMSTCAESYRALGGANFELYLPLILQ
jgi:hypothetical protein